MMRKMWINESGIKITNKDTSLDDRDSGGYTVGQEYDNRTN